MPSNATPSGPASRVGRLALGLAAIGLAALAGVGMSSASRVSTDEATTQGDDTPPLAVAVNAAMGLRDSRLVRLDVDLTPERPLRTVIEIRDRRYTLDLQVHSVRAPGYQVFLSDADGELTEVTPGPVNTLRGIVLEDPGSVVTASTMPDGLYGRIDFADGSQFTFEPVARALDRLGDPALAGVHVVYEAGDVLPTDAICGNDAQMDAQMRRMVDASDGAPVGPPVGEATGGIYRCEIACDADFLFFSRWGGAVEDRINSVLNTMDVEYTRDVNIRHAIVAIVIRTSLVYTTNDPGDLLVAFRSRWRSNHTGIHRDVAHLFTGRSLDGSVIGIAWLGVICDSLTNGFGYALVESDYNNNFDCAIDLSAHELGHNWDADHCTCSSYTMNPFITCGNRFHPSFTIPEVISFRDSRPCLDQDPDGPPNDNCDDAFLNPGGVFDFSTIGATTDGPTLPESCNEGRGTVFTKDIWYHLIALCDGFGVVDVCSANFDTRLAVYDDDACPSVLLACNDDRCGVNGTRSRVTFPVVQFQRYLIRLGGRGEVGTGLIDLSCVESLPCPADLDGNGVVDFGDIIPLLTAWGSCPGCPEDLDNSGVVDFADIIVVLTAWGPCE